MPEPGLPMVFYGTLAICKSVLVCQYRTLSQTNPRLFSTTLAGVSSFGTACWTTYRGTPNSGAYVTAAAMNSAITGFTFFTVREWAVSPLLTRLAPWAQYVERRRNLGIDGPSGDTLTDEPIQPPSLRTKNLLDSGISGAITGGIHRGLRSGRPAVASGTLFGAAVCTSGQYIFNELNLARLRYIARRNEEKATERTTRPPTFNPRTGKQEVQELPKSWTEMILVMFGLVPLTDDEYVAKLKRTRDVYLKKIQQLELTVAIEEEEKRLKELSES